jgi:hypothetical protein
MHCPLPVGVVRRFSFSFGSLGLANDQSPKPKAHGPMPHVMAPAAITHTPSHWVLDTHSNCGGVQLVTQKTRDQLRDQRREERRSQGPRYWPPFAPWVQGGARAGWVWSGGPNLAPGPLGSVAGPRPVPGLAPLPLLRTGAWRPGAEAARVLGSQAVAAAPSTCPGTRCNRRASFGKAFSDRQRLPSHAHFHSLTRSCADSD